MTRLVALDPPRPRTGGPAVNVTPTMRTTLEQAANPEGPQ